MQKGDLPQMQGWGVQLGAGRRDTAQLRAPWFPSGHLWSQSFLYLPPAYGVVDPEEDWAPGSWLEG